MQMWSEMPRWRWGTAPTSAVPLISESGGDVPVSVNQSVVVKFSLVDLISS